MALTDDVSVPSYEAYMASICNLQTQLLQIMANISAKHATAYSDRKLLKLGSEQVHCGSMRSVDRNE